MRSSGILLPVFSLPSPYGIGDLYREAYEFIDDLKRSGQHYWQILPIGPTGEDNCPYQAISSFAIDPVFLSPDKLLERGLLSEQDLEAAKEALGRDEWDHRIDYPNVKQKKMELLGKAYSSFVPEDSFRGFCQSEKEWLDPYADFMAGPGSIETEFYKWLQYEGFRQWEELVEYAHARGVEIIGDLPYFVAFHSVECSNEPEFFSLNEDGSKKFLAGAPPDAFSETGQCWGNPVYDWDAIAEDGYDWWKKRIAHQFRLFDVVRLDHMRGFESYFCIPAETEDPAQGHWEKGPGMELFRSIKEEMGSLRIIAEDLGYLTPEVKEMMEQAGFPGMKILQFAFDTGEENVYLPGNYETNRSVVYTGTHDNDTTIGWYEKAEEWKKKFVSWYLTGDGENILSPVDAARGLIGLAMSTRCDTCIIPMQDYLLLGSEARINVPGRAEDNWGWQMKKGSFTKELADRIRNITEINNRVV